MKIGNLLSSIGLTLLMTSCSTASFYQVYNVKPIGEAVSITDELFFEDENCKITYNLWSNGGNMGFVFYNKTDKNIFLNLNESFFVFNGIAYDYFQDRVFTNSKNSSATTVRSATASKSVSGNNYWNLFQTNRVQSTKSVAVVASNGYSVSYNEAKVIIIPTKTSKIIAEYNISQSLYRDCDLLKFPSIKQIKSKVFSKSESPIVFSNKISYTIEQSEKPIKFENEFYVTEISNYPESEILESKYDEFCGQKRMTMTKHFKKASPDKFFIKYNKGTDTWKH